MIKIYDSLRVFGSSSPLAFILFFLGPTMRLYWWRKFSSCLRFFPFDEILAFILFNLNFHLRAKHSIIPFLLDERLMKFTFHGVVEQISNPLDRSWLRQNDRNFFFVFKLHKKLLFLCFTNTHISSKTEKNVQIITIS